MKVRALVLIDSLPSEALWCTYSSSGPTECSFLCCNLQRRYAKSSTSFSSKAFSVLQNFGTARSHQVYNGGLGPNLVTKNCLAAMILNMNVAE
jgi:hypothetical protein